jgi:site-specific DNA-methyltransferase (adenine-specific)
LSWEELVGEVTAGDCLSLLPRVPDASVDLVLVDPPYNIGYEYDGYDDGREDREYLAWCHAWMAEAARVLRPTGSAVVVIGDEYAAELRVLLGGSRALDGLPARPPGLRLAPRNWVVWHYTFGNHCKTKLTRSHAHLLHAVRDPALAKWNRPLVPSARQLVYGDKRAAAAGRTPDDTWILRPQEAEAAGLLGPGGTLWHVPRVAGTFRERAGTPNQLPEALVARAVEMLTDPGDLVLDFFAGSGTTPAACERLGRRWAAFELSADYAARARERVARVRAGGAA